MTFETREPSDPHNESPAWIRLTLPPQKEVKPRKRSRKPTSKVLL